MYILFLNGYFSFVFAVPLSKPHNSTTTCLRIRVINAYGYLNAISYLSLYIHISASR